MLGLTYSSLASSGVSAFEFGNALDFDGTDDYVSIPSLTINGEFTLNIWFNGDFTAKSSPMLFSNNATADRIRTVQNFSVSESAMYVDLGGVSLIRFTFPEWSDNTWYMFTLTRDASNNLKAYINAVESTLTGVINGNNTTFELIGAYYTFGSFGFFNGKLDEVGFLTGTSATAQNVTDLYNGGNGALFTDVMGSATAYWRMNGTSGDTTAIDEQGSYNGTLNNFNTSTCWVAH